MAVITKCVSSVKVPAGQVIFTSSQIWTVPKGVKTIDVFVVGGGGSGSRPEYQKDNAKVYGGSGGAGGYTSTLKNVVVSPNQQIAVTVGAGGSVSTIYGYKGGASSFGSICIADGGGGSTSGYSLYTCGHNGGSGGGAAATAGTSTSYLADSGSGGDNGNNGTDAVPRYTYSSPKPTGGTGQGTTTKAFGESVYTTYAGGGSGGGAGYSMFGYNSGVPGTGGGKGGHGEDQYYYPDTINGKAGTANTGGGGGGGGYYKNVSSGTETRGYGGAGGSGIIIVRWVEQ